MLAIDRLGRPSGRLRRFARSRRLVLQGGGNRCASGESRRAEDCHRPRSTRLRSRRSRWWPCSWPARDSVDGERAGRHRHAARQRHRRERRGGSGRDRHRHRNADEHQPDRRQQRGRQLHLLEPQERHLLGRGGAAGLPQGHPAERARRRQHDDARGPDAGAGPADRGRHGRGRDAASPDRPDRHGPPARIEDRDRDPARLQPQLPGPAGDRAGHDAAVPAALAVLQLAGQPEHRGQRAAPHGEQHAHRGARQQPQDGPDERHHSVRRRARDRQRLDQQLRRGVRPVRRRDHQRHAEVGNERLQRERRSSLATPSPPTRATTRRGPPPRSRT